MSKKQKRKSSALQILAAQQNGAKSHGPVTPEGRAASARNAIRHGNCAKALVLTIEDEAAFADHQRAYFEEFQPVGEVEFGLVTDMVVAKWRQWRLWGLETALFDLQMDKQTKMIEQTFNRVDNATVCAIAFQAMADESKAMALLLRYETSMRRMHEKCLKTLLSLQATRKAAAPCEAPTTLETAQTAHPHPAPSAPHSALTSSPHGADTKPRPPGSELTPTKPTPEKLPNEPGDTQKEAA